VKPLAPPAGMMEFVSESDAFGPGEMSPGTRIDRYEMVRSVGVGGMGRVWLGRFRGKHGFEKRVAIKTILPELATQPQFRQMLLDEARISARLQHANVAQILDVGEHQGVTYIVFEWVEGSSLYKLCRAAEARGEPLALGPLVRVMINVCSGLQAAHELTDEEGRPLGIVHRDVTPSNIIVSQGGYAKLIDFGIAKAKGRIAAETRSGIVKGTPQYMAPEQARGDPVDRRCDVCAVGAVFYRALAGTPPFRDRFELEAFILERTELAPLPDRVPRAVREVVERAMRRDPAERFPGADELRFALERALVGDELRLSFEDMFPSTDLPAVQDDASDKATAAQGLAFARTSMADIPTVPPTTLSSPPMAGASRASRGGARRGSGGLKLALLVASLLAVVATSVLVWSMVVSAR
jgi:serine/threonine protein kinase